MLVFFLFFFINYFDDYFKIISRPIAGSQSDIRGRKATAHVLREILEMCEVIYQNGQPCKDQPEVTGILFGELFNIYVAISDKCVGILLRARKQGYVAFEGECLFQVILLIFKFKFNNLIIL